MARVLLIEDDPNQQLLFSSELEDAGHTVCVALNGEDGLEHLKTETFDIVVLDIQMPRVDGIEALQRIMDHDKRIPVVLHTAYGTYKDNFMTWAADAYVIKSHDLTELKKTIRRVLAERKIRAERENASST